MKTKAILQTTNECFYSCTMCLHKETHGSENLCTMPMDIYDKCISSIRSYGSIDTIWFGYNYDPLTDQLLLERLSKITDFKYRGITTIGMINRDYLISIIKSGTITSLGISVIGGTNFESVTGIKLEDHIKNIFSLKSMCDQYNVNMHLMISIKNDINEINYFRQVFKDIKFTCVPIDSRAGRLNYKFTTKVPPDNSYFSKYKCTVKSGELFINYDGSVSLCCQDWGKKLLIGDLLNQNIQCIDINTANVLSSINSTYCTKCFKDILIT